MIEIRDLNEEFDDEQAAAVIGGIKVEPLPPKSTSLGYDNVDSSSSVEFDMSYNSETDPALYGPLGESQHICIHTKYQDSQSSQ